MLLEDLLLAVAIGVVGLVVILPVVRLVRGALWRRKDPLAEAHERLRQAKLEAEAARVNREAERIYEQMYEESLSDDRAARPRIETEKEELVGEEGRTPPSKKGEA
jgi:heme exporter protein D